MSALAALGRMLGMTTEPDYDILKNERAARLALSRRNLFLAAGAMAVGRVLVPSSELVTAPKASSSWDAWNPHLMLAASAMIGVYITGSRR